VSHAGSWLDLMEWSATPSVGAPLQCRRSANSGLVNVRRNSESRRSLFVFPLPAALQNQTDLAASGLQDI
jgi:hypothetical protein